MVVKIKDDGDKVPHKEPKGTPSLSLLTQNVSHHRKKGKVIAVTKSDTTLATKDQSLSGAVEEQFELSTIKNMANKQLESETIKLVNNKQSEVLTTKMANKHPCTMCLKPFPSTSMLARHLLVHSGESSHKCAQCTKSFGQAANLKKHLLTHSGEKNYKCDQCETSFGQAANLKRHLLTHSGEKSHK